MQVLRPKLNLSIMQSKRLSGAILLHAITSMSTCERQRALRDGAIERLMIEEMWNTEDVYYTIE